MNQISSNSSLTFPTITDSHDVSFIFTPFIIDSVIHSRVTALHINKYLKTERLFYKLTEIDEPQMHESSTELLVTALLRSP